MRLALAIVAMFIAVAGCAAESRSPPVSTSRFGGPSSTEPEAANSLPLGSTVSGSLTPAAGNINTVRVGPAGVRGAGAQLAPAAPRND